MVEVRPLATSSWTTDQISPTIPASRRVDSGHSVPDHNITSHNENKSTIGFFLKKKETHIQKSQLKSKFRNSVNYYPEGSSDFVLREWDVASCYELRRWLIFCQNIILPYSFWIYSICTLSWQNQPKTKITAKQVSPVYVYLFYTDYLTTTNSFRSKEDDLHPLSFRYKI